MARRHHSIACLLALGIAAATQGAGAVGSGSFVIHPTTPGFGTAAWMVRLADVDSSGRPDAVVTSPSATTVWLNDGVGNFSGHPAAPSIAGGTSLALGDLNADGRVDIVVSGKVYMGTVTGWSPHATTPTFGSGGYVALGDIDGDGVVDAVLDGSAWLNNGTGGFSAHPTTPVFSGVAFTSVNLGDLDGDGDLDVVASGTQLVYVFMNDGAGNFTPHATVPTVGTPSGSQSMQHAVLGDLDGDGDLDVLAALSDLVGGSSSNLVLRNGGSGNLSLIGSFPGFSRVALGILDGDADRDALTDTTTGVWLNSGAGVFSAHPTPTDFGTSITSFALDDVDGDGDLDVLVTRNLNPGGTQVWLNVNAGFFGVNAAASPVAGGSVSCTPNPVISGGSSTCTAIANAGYTFASWGGNCSGTTTTCTLTNVTSARSVTANFSQNAYAITTAANPSNGGTVSCTNNPVTHGGNSVCTATPSTGFTFTGWSGDCGGSNCTLQAVTSAKSVTANFAENSYAITTAASPPNGGTVSCSPNPVTHGGSTTCTATPNGGFNFNGWSGACTGASCTISNVTSPRSVTANFVAAGPPRLVNIATRARVQTGHNVMIGGFVIGGTTSKTVAIRARGPSLASAGVSNFVVDPQLQLFSGSSQIAFNNNWGDAANASQIQSSGFAPADLRDAMILMALAPGAYTAIVTGVGGTTGIALVEVFEVDEVNTPLLNIATRAKVETGDNVLIGGFIVQGIGPQRVMLRARGPSLTQAGVPDVLANPQLQLFSGQTPIEYNDDWKQAANMADIQASGFQPSQDAESAILVTLAPGAYTAIVTGVGGTVGNAIVEVFALP